MLSELCRFGQAVAQNPVPICALLLVIFILYGGGTSLGLPLLFWHENRWKQAVAGAATTWLAAEVFFVTFLLSGNATQNIVSFFVIGALLWVATVAGRALLLEYRFLMETEAAQEGRSRMSRGIPGLGPGIRQVRGTQTAGLASVQVSTVPFLLGVLVATGITAFVISRQDWLNGVVGMPLSHVLRPFLQQHIVDRGLHGIAATFFASFVVVLFVSARVIPTVARTPAFDICVMLAAVAAGYGWLVFNFLFPGLVIVVVVVLVAIGGLNRRKVRVAAVASYEPDGAEYPPKRTLERSAPPKGCQPADSPESPLRFRSEGSRCTPHADDPRAPLVLVSVSGGGIRAATWTAAILAKLDECSEFRGATQLIAGASGGMMGAASWVGSLYATRQGGSPPPVDWSALADRVSRDSLSDVARQLVFRDLPFAFVPFTNRRDRGWAMEEAWKRNMKPALDATFQDLEEGEKRGWWPSLVFSPMLVEDGRRLLMTNLDLRALAKNEVVWLPPLASSLRRELEQASISAYHFADLFPDAWRTIPISTAARLSAAFAYVSPAAVLPTRPRRRIVDAGYYDNYGVDLVTGWLTETVSRQETRLWLQKNVSKILVIQIRDCVSELVVNPTGEGVSATPSEPGPLMSGLEGLTSPISAILSARESVMLFRNDAQLEAATKLYARHMGSNFLTTTIFEFKGEASLSWYLTRAEIDAIKTQACSEGIQGKLEAVKGWLTF